MHLAKFPRIRLGHFPTPLEPAKNLSVALGGANLWIKRDDCTGLATGGNKTRKLEFLMADAVEKGADVVITQGAVQSNHARQTAAAAAFLGLDCEIVLENRIGSTALDYLESGNVFLDHLIGAKVHPPFAADTDMNAVMEDIADKLRAEGRHPYVILGGGSNEIGALGYVNCALELVAQANDRGLKIDHIVHATGSAGTQAGLVAGLEAMHCDIPVLGISVRAPRDKQEETVFSLAEKTASYCGAEGAVGRQSIVVNSDYVGGGYGVPTESMIEAVKLTAQKEGILLDPVYSGKGMAGLIDLVRKGHFKKDENVVFLHTGGNVALFGYMDAFSS